MPTAKPIASLSGLIDIDMEDDTLNMEADAFPTPDSNQENAPGKKKSTRGKVASKRFTKPKTASRRASGESVPPKKAAPKKKAANTRAPLKEQTNAQHAEDTEEVDEFEDKKPEDTVMDELVQPKQPPKRKAPEKKAGRPQKKNPIEQVNTMAKDGEFEYTPTAVRQKNPVKKPSAAQAKKANAAKRQASVEPRQHEKIIPETQVPMDVDPSELPKEDEDDEDAIPQSVFRRTDNARNNIRHHQPTVARRRAGSASDTERGGNDPALRRKLGDMTKKFENLELKYRNLREVGIKEAEANFEKYKTQTQAKAKGEILYIVISISLILTFSSCGRFDNFTEERNNHAKVPIPRLTLTPKTNHRSRRRSSQNAGIGGPTLHLSLRIAKREQGPASQASQLT